MCLVGEMKWLFDVFSLERNNGYKRNLGYEFFEKEF